MPSSHSRTASERGARYSHEPQRAALHPSDGSPGQRSRHSRDSSSSLSELGTTPERPESTPELRSEAATSTTSAGDLLVAARARIRQLELLQDAQRQMEDLEKRLGLSVKRPSKRPRVSSDSSDSEDSHRHRAVIKPKNLMVFGDEMSIQQRKEWLEDLDRAFKGDPKKFATDQNRILFALDNMEKRQRMRWVSHIKNMSPEQQRTAETKWPHFEEWTKQCCRNLTDEEHDWAKRLNNARQRFSQSPLEFHQYLESLEDHYPPLPEEQRALQFYAKLSPELIDHIDTYSPTKPTRREEMVSLANQFWHSMRRGEHRNRTSGARTSQHTSAASVSSSNRNTTRGRGSRSSGREHFGHPSSQPANQQRNHSESGSKWKTLRDYAKEKGFAQGSCFNCGNTQHFWAAILPRNTRETPSNRGSALYRGSLYNQGHCGRKTPHPSFPYVEA